MSREHDAPAGCPWSPSPSGGPLSPSSHNAVGIPGSRLLTVDLRTRYYQIVLIDQGNAALSVPLTLSKSRKNSVRRIRFLYTCFFSCGR